MKRHLRNILLIVTLAIGHKAWGQIDTDAREIPWVTTSDTDIIWKKRVWRDLSVYEERNAQLRDDPRTPQKNVFANILLAGINEGVFNAYGGDGNERSHPLTKEMINGLIRCDPASLSVNTMKFLSFCMEHKNDSMEFTLEEAGTDVRKPENEMNQVKLPNDPIDTTSCIFPQQIEQYRIAEDWMFDKSHGQMQVRIVAIAPMVQSKPLFWLLYHDIRKYIAQYEMYKGKVGFGRNWIWYFESRNFSSKIIKVGEPIYSSEQKK